MEERFSGFVDHKHPVYTWKIFAFQELCIKRTYEERIQECKIITCILDMRWKKEFNPDYFANKIRYNRASNSKR